MLTKAIILGKEQNSNKYIIRLPLLETAASTEQFKIKATLCCDDGVCSPFNVNDVVYVDFENGLYEKPVILGKLSTEGLLDNKSSIPAVSYRMENLEVLGTTELSKDTKIGDITYQDLFTLIQKVQSVDDKVDILVETTWAELKSLRDSSSLIPGRKYRITDYVCTTIQAYTRSAGNVFDIVTVALDSSHLSEEAYAIKHHGDTYFENNDLSKWKIWYCLDNDNDRFLWAETNGIVVNNLIYTRNPLSDNTNAVHPYCWYNDVDSGIFLWSDSEDYSSINTVYTASTSSGVAVAVSSSHVANGKGVIYRMIDEFGNDCPYDFKNIIFGTYNLCFNRLSQGRVTGLPYYRDSSLDSGEYYGWTNMDGWHVYTKSIDLITQPTLYSDTSGTTIMYSGMSVIRSHSKSYSSYTFNRFYGPSDFSMSKPYWVSKSTYEISYYKSSCQNNKILPIYTHDNSKNANQRYNNKQKIPLISIHLTSTASPETQGSYFNRRLEDNTFSGSNLYILNTNNENNYYSNIISGSDLFIGISTVYNNDISMSHTDITSGGSTGQFYDNYFRRTSYCHFYKSIHDTAFNNVSSSTFNNIYNCIQSDNNAFTRITLIECHYLNFSQCSIQNCKFEGVNQLRCINGTMSYIYIGAENKSYSVYNTTLLGDCSYIQFGDSSQCYHGYKNITIDNAKYIYLYTDGEAIPSSTTNNYIQNINIHKNVCGSSSSNRLNLVVPRNNSFVTDYYPNNSEEYYV